MNPSLRAGAVLVVLGFAPAALAEPLGAQAAQKDMAALTATASMFTRITSFATGRRSLVFRLRS